MYTEDNAKKWKDPSYAFGTYTSSGSFDLDYESNMIMVAVVMNGDEMVENAEVSVYAGTELCGQSTEAVLNGKHFVTIGGTKGEANVLNFVVRTDDGEFFLQQSDLFQADAVRGTIVQPYVLQLSDAMGVEHLTTNAAGQQLYDLQGRKVTDAHVKKGVYINNRQKVIVK